MNVALYVRVSTTEQASEGYSIGEQTERLIHGHKVGVVRDENILNQGQSVPLGAREAV